MRRARALFLLVGCLAACVRGSSSRQGISRGTTWCGFGNVSASRDAIDGAFTAIDSCCRTHDICPATIRGMTSKFGYFNFRLFTISHCECDEEFRSCLKMAGRHGQESVKEKVRRIGSLFFNNAMATCFRLERVRVCETWNEDGDCQTFRTEKKIKTYSLRAF